MKVLQQGRAFASKASGSLVGRSGTEASASCSGRLPVAVQHLQRREKSALTTTDNGSMSAVTKSLLLDTLNLVRP